MIELSQLEQLIYIAEYGTLSEAANNMYVSQPTLTRNMKRLEEDFGVSLFTRQKNRLELNENGRLALEQAKIIVKMRDEMIHVVQTADRARRTISLGCCAPVPQNDLIRECTSLYPEMTISSELRDNDELMKGLENDIYQCILLPYKPEHENWFSVPYGTEHLMFALPDEHPKAHRTELSFAEMDGQNMIVYSKIGFWENMKHTMMPNSRFLMQNDRFDFQELVNTSILPSFVSDRIIEQGGMPPGRAAVPISDPEANVTYYLICKKKNKAKLNALFK